MIPSILFVGDSITVGAVGSSDHTGFRGPFSLKVPGIAHVGPFVDPKGHHHGGVGGATTDTILNKTTFVKSSSSMSVGSVKVAPTWMDLYKPTYLHLMIGTNDIIKNPTSDDAEIDAVVNKIADNVATMVTLAHKLNPSTIIYVASIPTAGPSWFTNEALALNRVYEKRAAAGQFSPGVRFIDTSSKINAAFKEVASSITVDGTHPNDRGYDLMAQALAANLSSAPAPVTSAPAANGSSGAERVVLAVGGAYVAYKLWTWWAS